MSELEPFFEKIRNDVDHIKKEIASGNLQVLSESTDWYLFFFTPVMQQLIDYHIEKFPDAEVSIMDAPNVCGPPVMEEFLKKSKPQECFRNALMVTKALNADYIEGYIIHAKMPKFPIRHAWNATEKGYLDITGEAHKLLDRKTVGLPGPFGNDRQPFRETCVYISLERWTAEKVIRQAKRTSRMALMIAGGSLCIANWAESNGFVPRGGCKTSRVT